MGCQLSTHEADRTIQRLAARQSGTVGRWQLIEAGVSARQIQRRLEAGKLVELHRGVYLAGTVKPRHADEMAALLAFRLKATLSHRTALALCLTSPPRTVLDTAALISDRYELEHLVAEAHFRGLASEAKLRSQLARNPRKRGSKRLRAVLDLPGGPKRTRSGGERALLRLLREHNLDGYETNAKVAGFEVDLLFTDQGLIVELDGFDGHSSRQAFERDRLKWATLQAAGFRVMPVTGRQMKDDPAGVTERLLAALRRR